jgi:hypothetical protein
MGLTGQCFQFESPEQYRQLALEMSDIANRLQREIEIQRALSHATPGVYKVQLEDLSASELIESLRSIFLHHSAVQNRALQFASVDNNIRLTTDRSLLDRVLSNMITNALEASNDQGTVRVRVADSAETVTFCVWNATEIPAGVKPRIFQRYFSTKRGIARGQGTFIMKLFSERYLRGQLSFSSSAAEGTEFRLSLPKGARGVNRNTGTKIPQQHG